MKLFIGWLAGLATAWTALAIWRRVPPFPDIDADYAREVDERRNDPPWKPGRPDFFDAAAFGRPDNPADIRREDVPPIIPAEGGYERY